MSSAGYLHRRAEVATYFDRTAADAWARLTSDAPLGRIRTTVREGRDTMRGTLLGWLPEDLSGLRLLDAGCGTGALSLAAARRGAEVLAVDLSPTLVQLAEDRVRALGDPAAARVHFRSGDMLDPAFGDFDIVVAMDSLIHYEPADAVQAMAALAARCRRQLLVTHVPSSPLLRAFKAVGRFFPRGNRSPSVVPVAAPRLHALLSADPDMARWGIGRTRQVQRGFYTSQALELLGPVDGSADPARGTAPLSSLSPQSPLPSSSSTQKYSPQPSPRSAPSSAPPSGTRS
jgi:magnesium-protoporphyrin O-methyltransferase